MYSFDICNAYQEGKCLMSGFVGCNEGDLLSVNTNDLSCNSFEEREDQICG
jgi:hypothetical protein